MKYDVERQMEERWYSVDAPSDSDTAAQAVAKTARGEGLYRARRADRPGSQYELFRVPEWGQPISLGIV